MTPLKKDSNSTSKNKKISKEDIGIIISLVTLVLVIFQTFVSQPQSDTKLTQIAAYMQQVASNTYTPKPYLSMEAKCYNLNPSYVKKYFNLDNITESYYMEEYTLTSRGAYASKPWVKITLSPNLVHTAITTIPANSKISEKDEQGSNEEILKTISVSWDNSLAPDNEVKILILYNATFTDKLKKNSIALDYGSMEIGTFRNYLNCNGFDIYSE
jgi:hypothetical protein